VSDSEGLNALHIAVTDGCMEMVKFLVSRGAYAHFKASEDEGIPSPCELAERHGHPAIVAYLKAQPIRDDSFRYDPPLEISNASGKPNTRLARRGSSTVEFQV